MIVESGATLDMNGFDNEVNTLSGGGTAVVENSAAGTSVWLGVGNDTTGSTFTGTLTDAGGGTGLLGLAKLGGDTFTLDGTNTFSGPTIVEGGNLEVDTPFGAEPGPVGRRHDDRYLCPEPEQLCNHVDGRLGRRGQRNRYRPVGHVHCHGERAQQWLLPHHRDGGLL